MRLEQFNAGHFPMIKEWWKGHDHPDLPIEIMPDIGVLSYGEDGKPLAFGVLYAANSASIGWIEWITTNPECTPFESYKGVSTVLDFLCKEAKDVGISWVLCTCRQKSLGRLLIKNGFAQTDENVSHFLKLITTK